MPSKLVILKEYKKQLVSFLDELIEQFPHEGDIVILRIFVKDQAPIIDLMEHFVEVILPLKEKVKKRDERFFLDNYILSIPDEYSDKEKINYFRDLWLSDHIDEESKKVIWQWFDMFVNLTEKYTTVE